MRLYRGTGNKLHVSRVCAGDLGAYDRTVNEGELFVLDEAGLVCKRCRNYRTYGGHRF